MCFGCAIVEVASAVIMFGKAPGGFGAAAPATGFGAKAPATGFGAPAAGGAGFGAAAAPATGFGAKTTGFGAAPTTGFGAAPTTGFGAKTATGFGAAGPQAPASNPYAKPAGSQGAAVVGQYLLQWDNVYNADHPECKFREFFYNMCTPGQGEHAIQREKLGPQLRGAPGCREEQWIIARRDNPDPERMYPAPVHFAVGLKQRATKQKQQVELYHKHVEHLLASLRELRSIHEDNQERFRKLVLEESMIEGRLLRAMCRAEALRQGGLKIGPERHSVAQRCEAATQKLQQLAQTLTDLEPLAQEGAEVGFTDETASAIAAIASTATIKDWSRFVELNEAGIAKLQRAIRGDARVVSTMLRRIDAAP